MSSEGSRVPIDWGGIAAGLAVVVLCLLFALNDMGWLS